MDYWKRLEKQGEVKECQFGRGKYKNPACCETRRDIVIIMWWQIRRFAGRKLPAVDLCGEITMREEAFQQVIGNS
jgi:hypothetical protein